MSYATSSLWIYKCARTELALDGGEFGVVIQPGVRIDLIEGSCIHAVTCV